MATDLVVPCQHFDMLCMKTVCHKKSQLITVITVMSLHLVTLCEESMKKAYMEADDDGADDNALAQIDPEEGGEEELREDDPEE